MSVESMAIALHHSQARTPTQRLILLGIANHDGDGGAWPSKATLARYAGVTDESTVRKALVELEQLGEIRRHIQQGGTSETPDDRRPNLYLFTLGCPPECDRSKHHRIGNTPRRTRLGQDETPRGGQAHTPTEPSSGTKDIDISSSSSPKRARATRCTDSPDAYHYDEDGRCLYCRRSA